VTASDTSNDAPTSARDVIATAAAPAAVGPYSQAIRVGNLVFTSGQVGIDPSTKQLVAGGIASETRQVLDNLDAILNESGSGLEHIVKTTCYLTDLVDLRVFNDAYAAMFGGQPPARATVIVTALPVTARVQIEAVAVVPR
jgi:2-iminobutanoate/2-iminopropanoate deaminase